MVTGLQFNKGDATKDSPGCRTNAATATVSSAPLSSLEDVALIDYSTSSPPQVPSGKCDDSLSDDSLPHTFCCRQSSAHSPEDIPKSCSRLDGHPHTQQELGEGFEGLHSALTQVTVSPTSEAPEQGTVQQSCETVTDRAENQYVCNYSKRTSTSQRASAYFNPSEGASFLAKSEFGTPYLS